MIERALILPHLQPIRVCGRRSLSDFVEKIEGCRWQMIFTEETIII